MSTQGTTSKKKGRGIARGLEVKKRMKEGGKIDGVHITEGKYLPVGPAEKIFKMEIGVLTRMLAPLRKFYWKDVTDSEKLPIFTQLEVIQINNILFYTYFLF